MGVPNQVVSRGFVLNDFIFTYNISGAVTEADVGKAVTQDTTAASTVKLAGAGDVVFGRLETFENRAALSMVVGAIARKFKDKLPAAVGHGIAVGDRVIGSATAGLVAKDGTANSHNPVVVEVGTDFVVVEKL